MKIIAHRGLLEGPDLNLENRPAVIEHALRNGFDAEIDAWYVGNKWYLGHDAPDEVYEVDMDFLNRNALWIHAKNLDALVALKNFGPRKYNFFWHENDKYTLTNTGYIWTYPGQKLSKDSVAVFLGTPSMTKEAIDFAHSCNGLLDAHGICTDYAIEMKNLLCK